VPSGATLDHISNPGGGANTFIDNVVLHIVVNNGFRTLGVSSHQHGSFNLVDTEVIGTASDEGSLYALAAYTDVPAKAVAYGKSGQTTAGTWAANLHYYRTGPKLEVLRRKRHTSVLGASVTSTSYTAVAGTLNFFFTGDRPVKIHIESYNGNAGGYFGAESTTTAADGQVGIYIGSARFAQFEHEIQVSASGANDTHVRTPGNLSHIVNLDSINGYTYDPTNYLGNQDVGIQAKAGSSGATYVFSGCVLVIEELPGNYLGG
jgi:hypothetical protein